MWFGIAVSILYKCIGMLRFTENFSASSNGRGPRAEGWFSDYLQERREEHMQNLVLVGGIKGRVREGREYVKLMDGLEAAVWQ